MLMSCCAEVRAHDSLLNTGAQDDPKRITNVLTRAFVPL